MIVVTGAYGFIGSCLVSYLNQKGHENIVAVDDFSKEDKKDNLFGKKVALRVSREEFPSWLRKHSEEVSFVFHIGARTDTTEFNYKVLEELNVEYSKNIFLLCTISRIPMVYASSAATYGSGEWGYKDDHELTKKLKPLNPYGVSKNEFDRWALRRRNKPPFWAGLKFFNVYGPNESHKGRMASVMFHFFHQIGEKGEVKLFRSHRKDYADGTQMRDFVYVKDLLKVLYFLYEKQQQVPSGIYNLGSGKARTYNDLANGIFQAMDMEPHIRYVDIPEDIRDRYQYFTEADMTKLRSAGYKDEFYSLEAGIEDYVKGYLKPDKRY